MSAEFDVAWREGALGLRFTPNERDEPVVCQVPAGSNAAVLASPAAVGDVLVGFRLAPAAPMQPLAGFDQLLSVLAHAPLPVTLRFRSRARDAPERVAAGAARRYEFSWAPGAALGVSLAMDPCSLHAAITRIDAAKMAPALRDQRPELGDVLVAIRGADRAVALDSMRFEDVIQTLRAFPRPCQLAFARFQADEDDDDARAQSKGPGAGAGEPARRPTLSKQPNQELPVRQPPAARPAHARRMPMWQRQSFKIDAPKAAVAHAPKAPGASPASDAKEPSPFYTVVYSGGAVGLHLRDCTQDERRTSATDRSGRTNGYSVAVREVTDPRSAAGLERATAGDLLMAIGQRDLQHMSFDQVRAELGRVSSPTPLLFKKRKAAASSGASGTSSSLVDALLLFLV